MSLQQSLDKIKILNQLFLQKKSLDFFKELNLDEEHDQLLNLNNQLNSIKYRIAVIGEFSSGKSTFINSILKKNLLPATYRPTTNQVMSIEHSNELDEVMVEGEQDKILSLSSENIIKLASTTKRNLSIKTSIPDPMDKFIIYDTPGVNDPSSLSEEIIYNLLGNSDIVIFMLRADSALKETERSFLEKLILKKDLGKFFFLINFSDNLNPKDSSEVKKHVIKGLGELLQWPIKEIEDRVFLYSAKQCLHSSLNKEFTDNSLFLRQRDDFLQQISLYCSESGKELTSEIVESALKEIRNKVTIKLSNAIAQVENKDQEYLDNIEQINYEINEFKLNIRSEELDFRKKIQANKQILIKNSQTEFLTFKKELIQEIQEAEDSKKLGDAWIQKRFVKLMDDRLALILDAFVDEIKKSSQDFEEDIKYSYSQSIQKIKGIKDNYDYSSLIAGAGVTTAGYLVISTALPWAIGAAGVAAVGTAALSLIPGVNIAVGALLATGAKGIVNMFISGAGLTNTAYGNLKNFVGNKVDENNKQTYVKELDQKLLAMKNSFINKLEIDIIPEKISAAIIESKFPMKNSFKEEEQTQIKYDRKLLSVQIQELILMREELHDFAYENNEVITNE